MAHESGYQYGCFDYTVRPADGCSNLADRYLGAWDRYKEITRISADGAECSGAIAVGEVLQICGTCLEHIPIVGEDTCSALARKYRVDRASIRTRDGNECTDPFFQGDSLTVVLSLNP